MKNYKSALSILALLFASTFANPASAMWNIALYDAYGGMEMTCRIIRNFTATERSTFFYHNYIVQGEMYYPDYGYTNYQESEVYQPQLSTDIDLSYTVFWWTNYPILVWMWSSWDVIVNSIPPLIHQYEDSWECREEIPYVWIIPY